MISFENQLNQEIETFLLIVFPQLHLKMFKCDLCAKFFSRNDSLQRHIKNIHDAYSEKDKGIKRKQYPEQYGRSIKRKKIPYSIWIRG